MSSVCLFVFKHIYKTDFDSMSFEQPINVNQLYELNIYEEDAKQKCSYCYIVIQACLTYLVNWNLVNLEM